MTTNRLLLCLGLLAASCTSSDSEHTETSGHSTDGTGGVSATSGTTSGSTLGESSGSVETSSTGSSSGDPTTTSETGGVASIRFAHMSVEQRPVMICADGAAVAPFEARSIAYPEVTAYVAIAAAAEFSLVPEGDDCAAESALSVPLELGENELATVVLYGDPGLPERPLELAVLLDASGTPPTNPDLARARVFHTDTDIGPIDVGVSPAEGVRLHVFGGVPYGGRASGSDVGQLGERHYVDGIPVVLPAERLNIWEHESPTVLGWFSTEDPPFEANGVFSVFAAGRVSTGTPEAVICRDEVESATERAPWAACEVFVPNRPDR
ncbi:MAG: DUF4397 domain-containing protein [Nannocystales bacterium]